MPTAMRLAFISAINKVPYLKHDRNIIWRAIRGNAGTRSVFFSR